ncbi:MAG: RtcB family protein, partial [bacterium]
LDANCRAQAERVSRVPILDGHLALMPDAHFGFGPPVGSALKTTGAVMPYAVGVDIGCGMIAVKTDIERGRLRGHESRILGHIRELIPSGVGTGHKRPLEQSQAFFTENGLPPGISASDGLSNRQGLLAAQKHSLEDRARIQFGTLGSGNHFVEVCEDRDGFVWLLLHSGSRGIGNILASAHVDEARRFCKQNDIKVEHNEFAYVVEGSDEFRSYIADMLWCQNYAYQQREAMMDSLILAISREIGEDWNQVERINCHHNYAEEIEPGTWLTRKGAIDASAGKEGIIPGSMGASTYIVRGKGDAESYNTSPHGAGRILGRKQSRRDLDIDEFKRQMAGKTWLDRDAKALLDEAPSAYKPIEQVIADSAPLIEPVTVISQFINYKGL